MYIKLIALNSRFTHSCLALFHVRQELEKFLPDARVEIFQYTINDPFYETLIRIIADEPDCIMFSAAIWNSERLGYLLADIGKCSSAHLIVGGPQAAVMADDISSKCTFVTGDAEALGAGFFTDLQQRTMQPSYGDSFLHLEEKSLTSPYKTKDFQSQLKNRHIYYESSRGCPFACTYCLSSVEQGVFHKDLSQVKQEMDLILEHKPGVVRFIDRTFNDQPQRALGIWKYLLETEGDTLFHFEIAPERFTEEQFQLLETVPANRFQFEIGVQSTNVDTLQAVHRFSNQETVHSVISRLAAIGTIHLHVDLILGLPCETEESFKQSLRDVFAMSPHYIQMGLLKLLPGTAICRDADKYGYKACDHPPYAVLSSYWMDPSTMQRLYWFSECVERFMNNRFFCSLWVYLRGQNEDIAQFFQALLELCQKENFFFLAPTQEFMSRLLLQMVAGRDDAGIIKELLRFDWLRCGFRFLPDCLTFGKGELDFKEIKKILYQQLPDQFEGRYISQTRSMFLKKNVFVGFSQSALDHLGFLQAVKGENENILCFSGKRESSPYRLQEVFLL